MKKIFTLVLFCSLCLVLTSPVLAKNNSKAEKTIETAIEKFYELSYDSLMDLKLKDMSSILDYKSKFCINYKRALWGNIAENKYAKEKGYSDFDRKRLPIDIKIEEISIKKNRARVKVKIDGNRSEGYPLFVCFDENIFNLKKKNGTWLIRSIKNNEKWFYILNTKDFKKESLEALKKRVDKEYAH